MARTMRRNIYTKSANLHNSLSTASAIPVLLFSCPYGVPRLSSHIPHLCRSSHPQVTTILHSPRIVPQKQARFCVTMPKNQPKAPKMAILPQKSLHFCGTMPPRPERSTGVSFARKQWKKHKKKKKSSPEYLKSY